MEIYVHDSFKLSQKRPFFEDENLIFKFAGYKDLILPFPVDASVKNIAYHL
jgi:hypothetical protein